MMIQGFDSPSELLQELKRPSEDLILRRAQTDLSMAIHLPPSWPSHDLLVDFLLQAACPMTIATRMLQR
jgi:hypothetical protein